jgi:ribosome biogenesis GTPase A
MAPMANGKSTLAAALNSLASLATERDREQLLALLDRLDAARLRVLVVGEAKRGKSTLINALLGRDVPHRVGVPVGHPGSP